MSIDGLLQTAVHCIFAVTAFQLCEEVDGEELGVLAVVGCVVEGLEFAGRPLGPFRQEVSPFTVLLGLNNAFQSVLMPMVDQFPAVFEPQHAGEELLNQPDLVF